MPGRNGYTEKECFFLPLSLYRLLSESVVQIKGVPSHLNIWIKYPCYGASRFGSIECVFLSQDLDQMHAVFLPQGLDHKFPSIPDTVELTTKNGHPMG